MYSNNGLCTEGTVINLFINRPLSLITAIKNIPKVNKEKLNKCHV